MTTTNRATWVVMLLVPITLWAGEIIDKAPSEPDPGAHYVFYLHGQIVQDSGPRPTHPRWGLYDYPLILESLAQDNLVVVSERREKGTDPMMYSQFVAKQVKNLLSADVNPRNITVVGFSVGGFIAIQVSSQLPRAKINYVILAACSDWMYEARGVRLHGQVLSVFEESDAAYSCMELAERSPGPTSFDEISIDTGKEHGAFYLPHDVWIRPTLEWIQR
ncbi:MAG: alpha/beta hydrolase [Woeseiaceae bacterium]